MTSDKSLTPGWLNKEYITSAFRKYYPTKDITVEHISVTGGSKAGDNFLGQILRIKCDLKIKGDVTQKYLIGKCTLDSSLANSYDEYIDLFQIETDFYSLVLPKIKKVLYNFDATQRVAPECYLIDNKRKLILMEDLNKKGFFLQESKSPLTKDQALLVLKKLALLHGASYKALVEEPELKEKFQVMLLPCKVNDVLIRFVNVYATGLEMYWQSYGLSEERIQKMRDIEIKLKKEAFSFVRAEEGLLNFLLHGDSWIGNMLFHATNEIVDDVILIDFQGVTYNSFANDLLPFLFMNVATDVLIDCLDELLEHYYKELVAIIPEIPNLSLKRIKKEFADRLVLGMIMFCIHRTCILSDVPLEANAMLGGDVQDIGYGDKRFISDLQKIFPLFDKITI